MSEWQIPPGGKGLARPKRKPADRAPKPSALEKLLAEHAIPDDEDILPDDDDQLELPEDEDESCPLTTLERDELRDIVVELASREEESLALYEPMEEQDRFHRSLAPERIIRGGNRGGKTLAACVEMARALTGQDPYQKYSPTNGRAIVVGKDLLHCSEVIYRKLFLPGAFQLIRDPETGKMRAFRPGNQWDDDHAEEAKDAPPLIPHRFYKANWIAWDDKRREVPKSVRFTTGWKLVFFSSLGPPPQGWDADIAHFDEEIVHPKWYGEVQARLMDRRRWNRTLGIVQNGKFWWSATPQAGTQQLYDLSQKAEECRDEDKPSVVEFFCSLLGNTHITTAAKAEFIKKLEGNEDEYRIRVLGDFALLGMRVYPEFIPRGVHGTAAFPIPREWTKYCAIDPGRQVCAVLFCAIAPPNTAWSGRKIIYDELYIKKCSAKLFAQKMFEKIGDTGIYEFLIDHHAGRITETGSGKTIEEQYSEALKAVGISSDRTGHGFTWAADDVEAGIEAVRRGLHVTDGKAEWVVFWEKVPNMLYEASRYCYQRIKTSDVVTDKPWQKNNHLMDAWRYLGSHRLRYVKPKTDPKRGKGGYAFEKIRAKKKKARKTLGWNGSIKLG